MNLARLFERSIDNRSYAAGEVVLSEGSANKQLYVVIEGEFEISHAGKVLETVPPGGIFGELSLIDDQPTSATVTSKDEGTLAAVDEKKFNFLVQNHPFFALEVMKVMAGRLRYMTDPNKG